MRRRRSGLNFGRQKKKVNMSVVKEVCVWIIEIAITLLVAFTLVYFVGLRTSVVGQSMAETLNGGAGRDPAWDRGKPSLCGKGRRD